MEVSVAHFGVHKLLSDTLHNLVLKELFPAVVIFPPVESVYHQKAEEICKRFSIPVLRPQSVKDPAFIEKLQSYQINRIVVTGYPQIFPQSLLDLADEGAINCHGGLLPEEKGPVPWKWAVYQNKPFTGITVHRMTAKVDMGEILLKIRIPLADQETSETMFNKIAGEMAVTVPGFYKKKVAKVYYHEEWNLVQPGYQGQVPPELCVFDLNLTAGELDRRVRAFSPRPGVFYQHEGENVLVKKIEMNLDKAGENDLILKSADRLIAITDFEQIVK